MSAPIVGQLNRILGVFAWDQLPPILPEVQISRKGQHPAAAGPDFTSGELEDLEFAARRLAMLKPEVLLGEPKKPRWRLELHNEQRKKAKASRRG